MKEGESCSNYGAGFWPYFACGSDRHHHHHEGPHGRGGPHGPHGLGAPWTLGHGRYATKRFIVPGLLLLVAEEPSHGYMLQKKLVEMGVVEDNLPLPTIYRILNHAEKSGLVHSEMVVEEGKGPARKVYRLTDVGLEWLTNWYEQMGNMKKLIDEFEKRYEALSIKK